MKTITATAEQCVLKWEATVGESPLWHPQQKRLYWVDIPGKKVHRFDPATGRNETFPTPEIVPCLAFRASGGLVLLLRKHIAYFNPDAGTLEIGQELEADQPDNRFNDGRVDPQGRFWPGTMSDKDMKAPTGGLYRLTPDKQIVRFRDQIACANGSAWSPDGRTMYFTESFRFTIWAFDFDHATGDLSNQRAFVTLPKGEVFPDGLCVDADGFVWSNHVGAGKVVRYDPTGKAERQVQLPVPRAAGSTFGGENLATLYVTSLRENMSAEQLAQFPLSGSLFAIDVGCRGIPAVPFAG
jgi:sugar lactone lactonase YvrE